MSLLHASRLEAFQPFLRFYMIPHSVIVQLIWIPFQPFLRFNAAYVDENGSFLICV